MLWSINPTVVGMRVMFKQMQHALTMKIRRGIAFSTPVQDVVLAWGKLAGILAQKPAHLTKLKPFLPYWVSTTDVSGIGMWAYVANPLDNLLCGDYNFRPLPRII